MLDLIVSLVGYVLVLVATAVAAALYFLPTIIVLTRRSPNMTAVVIVLNLLLGWTFIGWVVSLVLSLVSFSPSHQHHYYSYSPDPAVQSGPAVGGYGAGSYSPNGAAVTDHTAGAIAPPNRS